MRRELFSAFSEGLIDKSLRWPSRWAPNKLWMPAPFEGPLDFRHFPWAPGILDTMEGQVSVMKASQMACSVIAIIKALFTAIEQRDEAMIVQPTKEAANAFAHSRLDAVIALSPALRDMFPKNDSAGLKTTKYHSHIFMRGGISEAGLTGQPVSVAVIDEFDRCPPKALPLIRKRMSARAESQRHIFALSTPILPEMGIDEQFQLGTQERFVFDCPSCSRGITLEWPDCVEIYGSSPQDPRCQDSYFKCSKCHAELPVDLRCLDINDKNKHVMKPWLSTARWEANAEARYHRSFYIPQMYGPKITAGEMVVEYFNAQLSEYEKAEFTNQSLGLPYIMEGARLNETVINKCRGSHSIEDPAPENGTIEGFVVMGIDTGSMLDCVVTQYAYDRPPGFEPHLASVAKVLQVRRIPRSADGYKQMYNMMQEYSIDHAVIDFQPETTKAEEFAETFHGGVSLNQYREGTLGTDIKCKLNENRHPILTVDRTSFLDLVMARFYNGRIIIPQDSSYVFIEHLLTPIRTRLKDKFDRPVDTYVKANNKADHLAHSLLLCEVAHMRAYAKQSGRSVGGDDSIRDF